MNDSPHTKNNDHPKYNYIPHYWVAEADVGKREMSRGGWGMQRDRGAIG